MIGPDYNQIPKKSRLAGARAVQKAVSEGKAKEILVAKDAESKIIAKVLLLAEERGIKVVWVSGKQQLGEYCGISVGASCCALLDSTDFKQ